MSAIQRFPTLRVGSMAGLSTWLAAGTSVITAAVDRRQRAALRTGCLIAHPLTIVVAGTVGSGGWFHLRPR